MIRKNQFDPMAGIDYSLGCSLIHFALQIALYFVKWPDLEKAREFDDTYYAKITEINKEYRFDRTKSCYCEDETQICQTLMTYLLVIHMIAMIMTSYRETSGS